MSISRRLPQLLPCSTDLLLLRDHLTMVMCHPIYLLLHVSPVQSLLTLQLLIWVVWPWPIPRFNADSSSLLHVSQSRSHPRPLLTPAYADHFTAHSWWFLYYPLRGGCNQLDTGIYKWRPRRDHPWLHFVALAALVYHFRIRFIIGGHTDALGLIRWKIYCKFLLQVIFLRPYNLFHCCNHHVLTCQQWHRKCHITINS